MTRVEWVKSKAEEPILDVGCGDSVYFDDDVDYTGLDIDDESSDIEHGRPQSFIKGDAHDLPFDSSEFNTVVLAEVLEHVDNPVKVLMEANRVAGNKVLITVPDELRWMEAADPDMNEDHKRKYTGDIIMDQLKHAGYGEERMIFNHLNEPPFAFWIIEYDVIPTGAMTDFQY